jgi:hypothetical protein
MDEINENIAVLQFELKNAGITDGGIARLTRFIKLDFTTKESQKELKRWIEVGLIKDGKIVITPNDAEDLSIINFCLWDSVYTDDLKFIPPDRYQLSDKAKKQIEAGLYFANTELRQAKEREQ